jgi:hypothetical protein
MLHNKAKINMTKVEKMARSTSHKLLYKYAALRDLCNIGVTLAEKRREMVKKSI